MSKNKKKSASQIATNKNARFEYHLIEDFEAGLQLLGWEVKSLHSIGERGASVSIAESYVFIRDGEAFVSGITINPLISTSTHVKAEPTRVRKLLLNKREIEKLQGKVEREGMTIAAVKLYWSENRKVKLQISLAKGKNTHDKRQTEKNRDWNRDKQRLQKINLR